jgi:hypothetical protein
MSIWCLQGAAGGGWICVAYNLYEICLGVPLGGFIYAASKSLQRIFAFYSKSVCWALWASCISFEWASSFADSGYAKSEDPMGHILVINPMDIRDTTHLRT